MRTHKITGAVAFLSLVTIVAAGAHAATPVTHGADASRIAVTDVAGSVDVTMAGRLVAVRQDSTMLLPARVVTGADGTLGMTQAGTHIKVAHDTDVEIPAEAVDGNLVARLVQHRGNVFYDVAPRDLGKLRVETPFLVAVIKGTQFNVSVQADRTTIALFEGQLQILTPDGIGVVELNAGEIAIRSLIDDAIRVVGMDDERVAVPAPVAAQQADAAAAQTSPSAAVATEVAVANREGRAKDDAETKKPAVAADVSVDLGVAVTVDLADEKRGRAVGHTGDVGLRAAEDLGVATDVGVGKNDADVGVVLDLGGTGAEVDVDAGLDLDRADVDTGTRVDVDVDIVDAGADLGAGSLDVAAAADNALGGLVVADAQASVDLGGLDLGAALDLDTDLDLGDALDLDVVDPDEESTAAPGSEPTTPAPVLPKLPGLSRP